jgi:hypothetical protein
MLDPTPHLIPSGLTAYNKLNTRQKQRPLDYLRPHHFKSYDLYMEFEKECKIEPLRDRIGPLTDPNSLDRLCEILAQMQDEMSDLESRKADREYY